MAIIPVRAIAERRVAEHFIAIGATRPEKATDWIPDRWPRVRALARLRDLGVVRGQDGALWMDEVSWDDRRGVRRKRAFALLALGAISAGIAGLTTFRS